MLRYAGYIDAASNMYEVPRPPRRGSHRPEGVYWEYENGRGLSPPGMNAEPPLSKLAFTTPLVRTSPAANSTSLGKRALMTTSPVLAKEKDRFLAAERNMASTRASFMMRNIRNMKTRENELSHHSDGQREHVATSIGRNSNYTGGDQAIKRECATREKFGNGSSPDSTAKTGTSRTPVSVDLVSQLNGSSRTTFSPTNSILESYAKTIPLSASCQTIQKRCMYPDCTKISVSRGLCRGHGGGRRCHFLGCSKSAQSRSNFCWAHGGGQRCEVQNCMRSRKSKRFCVAHVQFESTGYLDQAPSWGRNGCGRLMQDPTSCKQQVPMMQRYLPSLGQALSSASRSPPNFPGL